MQHYQFEPCPDKNKIFNTYTKFNDLISTLENLSDNSIIHILHCAKSILNAIRDSYFLYFYEGDEVLYCGNTLNKKRMSISGIIGSANSSHKDATLEKLRAIEQEINSASYFKNPYL